MQSAMNLSRYTMAQSGGHHKAALREIIWLYYYKNSILGVYTCELNEGYM